MFELCQPIDCEADSLEQTSWTAGTTGSNKWWYERQQLWWQRWERVMEKEVRPIPLTQLVVRLVPALFGSSSNWDGNGWQTAFWFFMIHTDPRLQTSSTSICAYVTENISTLPLPLIIVGWLHIPYYVRYIWWVYILPEYQYVCASLIKPDS